ncbi:MAG: hypothetical protein R6V32_07625, partial [Bacteroidales bacterium]
SVMHHPFIPEKSLEIKHCLKEPLLHSVMENGKPLNKPKTVNKIARYSQKRLNQIPSEYRRFLNPHEYKIGLSPALKKKRDGLIKK